MGSALPDSTTVPGNRLVQFRALRAKLDPAGDPSRAIDAGLYVARSSSVSKRIAAGIALAPATSHLLVGGIGSGKTTELLAVKRELDATGDILPMYIDVTKRHDISKLSPHSVVIQVAYDLTDKLLSSEFHLDTNARSSVEAHKVRVSAEAFGEVLFGHDIDAFEHDPDWHDGLEVDGILTPPDSMTKATARLERLLKKTLDFLTVAAPEKLLTVLLDGLDRVTDLSAFEQVIGTDIKLLGALGIGVVIVGPIRAQYGMDRTIFDQFAEVHQQPALDASTPADRDFLKMILRKRLAESELTTAGLETLVVGSGGVLRDLMSLAQSACVEAYMDGSQVISQKHAEAAIDAFGRKHMQGLRATELDSLKRLLKKGTFVETSEDDLALLTTRRVLEYRASGSSRYQLHPTIVPFIAGLTAA
jgi:hypothetical protein